LQFSNKLPSLDELSESRVHCVEIMVVNHVSFSDTVCVFTTTFSGLQHLLMFVVIMLLKIKWNSYKAVGAVFSLKVFNSLLFQLFPWVV